MMKVNSIADKIKKWMLWNVFPCEKLTVPFSEVEDNQCFWLGDNCFIKENEDFIFKGGAEMRVFPRPFHRNYMVDVFDEKEI